MTQVHKTSLVVNRVNPYVFVRGSQNKPAEAVKGGPHVVSRPDVELRALLKCRQWRYTPPWRVGGGSPAAPVEPGRPWSGTVGYAKTWHGGIHRPKEVRACQRGEGLAQDWQPDGKPGPRSVDQVGLTAVIAELTARARWWGLVGPGSETFAFASGSVGMRLPKKTRECQDHD
ncbi:hypothetical protein P280DRAFT_531073 [Massarina eburnea CBS 473.64]|uniref:Uncharacterized protein n=1 Tax=Massarina eburnea CBS 473.64 TaxID=1395130 RepID=A0A6A6RP13_9PLEO|nr:hypothetical protein P280DRAFT_531073 [Massarina eburnea CBS 473.64]